MPLHWWSMGRMSLTLVVYCWAMIGKVDTLESTRALGQELLLLPVAGKLGPEGLPGM